MGLARNLLAGLAALACCPGASRAQDVAQLFQSSSMDYVTRDAADNIYVANFNDVYRIAPGGPVVQIFEGSEEPLVVRTDAVLVDASGNLFIADGNQDRVVRVTPSGVASIVIDSSGDGVTPLDGPRTMVMDSAGNLYVSSRNNADVYHLFRATPGGAVSVLLDDAAVFAVTGSGLHSNELAIDAADNVFVALKNTSGVVRRAPDGTLTQVIDATGDGQGNPLSSVTFLATDHADNLYVVGNGSQNVFRVTPQGSIIELIDAGGDGAGNALTNPVGVDVDAYGNAFVLGAFSDNVFKISPTGVVTEVLDSSGNGSGVTIDRPHSVMTDGIGGVLLTSLLSANLVRLTTVAGSLVRNGTGVNALGYTEVTPPILGTNWETTVDIATPGAVLSAVDIVAGGPLDGLPLAIGELLCLPPSLASSLVAGSDHSIALPSNPALAGAQFCTQAVAVKLGPLELQLQNALDVTLGTF